MFKFFKNIWNGFLTVIGVKTFKVGSYKRTDFKEFEKEFETGKLGIGFVSDKDIEFYKNGKFDWMDFLRGFIQGVSNDFWQHCFFVRKENDERIYIIESLEKVTMRKLDSYNIEYYQMVIFFPNINKKKGNLIWNKALMAIGKEYDYFELLSHLDGPFKLLPNDEKLNVCSTLLTWASHLLLKIIPKNMNRKKIKPSNIYHYIKRKIYWRVVLFNIDKLDKKYKKMEG